MARDELADSIYYSLLEYKKHIIDRTDEEAKEIQKLMLPMVKQASPVRKHKETKPITSKHRGYVKIQQEGEHFKDLWEIAKRKPIDGAYLYGVRNKRYNLTHLLNFDHIHYSGFLGDYTGMTHQEHAGFVDDVSEAAQKLFNERIQKIIEEEYEG